MFRTQSVQNKHHVGPKPMVEAGAASVTPRKGVGFIQIKGLASCRKWLQSYFYVKNVSPSVDALNLPLYRSGADTALQFLLSWYEQLDFESIRAIRAGSTVNEDPEKIKKRRASAAYMAQFADVHQFFADPSAPEQEDTNDNEENEETEESEGDSDDLLIEDRH